MKTVNLITDYGTKDESVGSLHSVIYETCKHVKIIDLHHNIPKFNIPIASFIVNRLKPHLKGRINLIIVDPKVGSRQESLLFECKEETYFLAPNNGVASSAAKDLGIKKIYTIPKPAKLRGHIFYGRDVYAPAVKKILSGRIDYPLFRGKVSEPGSLTDYVITDIDNYGNCYTNFPDSKLRGLKTVSMKGRVLALQICKSFFDLKKGKIGVTKDGDGYAVLFLNKSSLAQRYGIEAGTKIRFPNVNSISRPVNTITIGKVRTKGTKDVKFFIECIKKSCKKWKVSLLNTNYHIFGNKGVTIIGILSMSHVAVHTWPENRIVFIDIFSCKGNSEDMFDYIAKLIGGEVLEKNTYER